MNPINATDKNGQAKERIQTFYACDSEYICAYSCDDYFFSVQGRQWEFELGIKRVSK